VRSLNVFQLTLLNALGSGWMRYPAYQINSAKENGSDGECTFGCVCLNARERTDRANLPLIRTRHDFSVFLTQFPPIFAG
jgi:hypothetical protein